MKSPNLAALADIRVWILANPNGEYDRSVTVDVYSDDGEIIVGCTAHLDAGQGTDSVWDGLTKKVCHDRHHTIGSAWRCCKRAMQDNASFAGKARRGEAKP